MSLVVADPSLGAEETDEYPLPDRGGGIAGNESECLTRSIVGVAYEQVVRARKARLAARKRLDDQGYPRGLKGDAIAFETRIVSVADVFDALTANRPYRAAMSLEKALGIMRADVGTAFDSTCFAALERALVAIEGDLARAA